MGRSGRSARLVLAALVGAVAACRLIVGIDDRTVNVVAGADSAPGDGDVVADAAFIPAPHPKAGNIVETEGGVVMATPRIVPIFFPGYEHSTDVYTLLQSELVQYWFDTVHEYGVTPIPGAAPPIYVPDAAPTTIAMEAIPQWLAGKFASDPTDFGVPSSSKVYTIFLPQTTTVTDGTGAPISCTYPFWGDQADVAGTTVTFLVIEDCLYGDAGITWLAAAGWLTTMTNPFPVTRPAYAQCDQLAWILTGSCGIGVLCNGLSQPITLDFGYGTVALAWSNEAANQGHNPCVPAQGSVYFNAAPVLPDKVSIGGGYPPGAGVHIPAGQSKTIDIDLFSDAPTPGPWTVDVLETLSNTGSGLSFAWDKQSGQNGDVLHLTITAPSDAHGWEVFVISSTLGSTYNGWPGLVTN